MLRSFDYAMHSSLDRSARQRPDVFAALNELARRWRGAVETAFVEAYDATAEQRGLSTARADRGALLELFTLEKLVYELGYEMTHRPEWTAIPLAGLVELLALP
jgi:maltose alpha-D-glucosyltransferase/alpha-amylase